MFTMGIKIHENVAIDSNKKIYSIKKNTHKPNINELNAENYDGGNDTSNEIKLSKERTNEWNVKCYVPDVWLSEWVVNCEYCTDKTV